MKGGIQSLAFQLSILLAFGPSVILPAQSKATTKSPIPHTPVIERGKEAYIRNDCYSCHGGYQVPDPRHGDLAKSSLVQIDNDGSVLRGFIKSGSICTIAKDNQDHAMMPGYWDMPDIEMSELITYIHFTRQELRYKELIKDSQAAGNKEKGEEFFKGECSKCHSGSDLSKSVSEATPTALRSNVLFPDKLTKAAQTGNSQGVLTHKKLLERYSSEDVNDLVAYLNSMKK